MRFIGPHVSIEKDIALAPGRARALGATGFALFTKNQRVWKAPPLREESIEAFRKSPYPASAVLPHAGYLINPASPDPELWEKSYRLFSDEAGRVLSLGLDVINLHPGAYKEGERIDGIKRSAAMIDRVLSENPGLRIAVENTAGAGTIIGASFEELETLLSLSSIPERIGFTLDTAHLYGAGYDVASDPAGVLDSFFSRFGKEKLYGMHLNDSAVPLGSHKDRHASLGKGFIGKEAIKAAAECTDGIPLILETPDESLWPDEIAFLKEE